jgi:CheY-like chemotaxis protein
VETHLLLVENEADIAAALLRRLRARGHTVDLATDAEAARGLFAQKAPALVIISLTLPEGGGERLCRGLRTRPRGGLVPILFLGTGDESVRTPGEAIAAGADHFFRKPEELDALLDRVAVFLGPVVAAPAASPAAAPAGTASPRTANTDASAGFHSAFDDDPPDLDDEPTVLDGFSPADIARRADEARHAHTQPLTTSPDRPGFGLHPARPPALDPEAVWSQVLQPGRAVPLTRRGLGEILAAAWKVRLTGRIEVAAGGVLRRVFFDHGAPTFADSSSEREDLPAHLAAEGYVSRGALAQARARSQAIGGTPEEVLLDGGLLLPEDVWRALHGFVVDGVLNLFALEAGESTVVQGGPRPLDPVDLGLHPGRLVLDGVRRKYGRLRLYRAYGTPTVTPLPVPGAVREGLALRADEEAVLLACDGRRTVVEVARAARVGEVDALAILYGLTALGLVETPATGGARAGTLPPLADEVLARAGAPRTADDLPGFGELVAAKLAEVQTADYFLVLGVPRGAAMSEIRAAVETLKRRFDPHRVRREGSLWHPVQEIAAVVDDAWAMLGDPRLRARYEAALR